MSTLDICTICGRPVHDLDRDGYEAESGQRGHFTCEGDAPTRYIILEGMGGFICGECGDPVETEPCAQHQRARRARWGMDS